jgi:hypothetical protein
MKPRYISSLIYLLEYADTQSSIAESVALIIANCCDSAVQQGSFSQSGAIPRLGKLVCSINPKIKEAALDALSSLCRENETIAKELADLQCKLHQKCLTKWKTVKS